MQAIYQNADKNSSVLSHKIDNIVYSNNFSISLCFIALFFWILNLQLIGFAILAIIASFILILKEDILPALITLFILPATLRDAELAFTEQAYFAFACVGLIIVCAIYHFIKFPIKKLKFDKLAITLCAILGFFILTYLLSPYFNQTTKGIDIIAIAFISPLVLHLAISNGVKQNTQVNPIKYFIFSFLMFVNLCGVELLLVCFQSASEQVFILGPCIELLTGWANPIHIANFAIMGIALCSYLITDSKKPWLIISEIIVLYFIILASTSHGSLVTSIAFFPLFFYYAYKNASLDNKKVLLTALKVLLSLISLCLIVGLYLYKNSDKFNSLIHEYIETASLGRGRMLCYECAIEVFKNHPIFGAGFEGSMFLIPIHYSTDGFNGFFHSTFFHILACGGIIGIIIYVIYYVVRLKHINSNGGVLSAFITLSFIAFAVYGIVDNSEFNIVVIYMTALISFVGTINKSGIDQRSLPLTNNKIKF